MFTRSAMKAALSWHPQTYFDVSTLQAISKVFERIVTASIKCNCSLSMPRIIYIFFPILVTEVSCWSARNVSAVATTILKSLVDVEMYYVLHHYVKLCGHYRDC